MNAQALTIRPAINHWPPQLVIDLALGVEGTDEILERYALDSNDLDALSTNPAFRAQLVEARNIVAKEGLTFRKKAALLAEMHLDTISSLVDDVDAPAATRLAAFQSLAKLGNLEPIKEDKANQNNMQFNLQICL